MYIICLEKQSAYPMREAKNIKEKLLNPNLLLFVLLLHRTRIRIVKLKKNVDA